MIYRHLSSNQPSDIEIVYKVSSFGDPFSREEEQKMKQYSFNSVEAVNGRLHVSVTYRLNLSEFSLQSSTAFPPVIITGYVGSPAIDPMRAFPTVKKASHQTSFSLRGTRTACSTPSQRPHSWSSGIHFAAAHKQIYPLGGSPPPYRGLFSPNDDHLHLHMYEIKEFIIIGCLEDITKLTIMMSCFHLHFLHLRLHLDLHLRQHTSLDQVLTSLSAPVAIPYPMLNRSPRYSSPNLSDPNRLLLPPFSSKGTKPEPSLHGSPSPSGNRLSRKLDALRPEEVHSGMTNLSYGSKISRDSKDESGRFSWLLSSGSSPHRAFSRSSSELSFQDELDVCDFSCPFDVDDVDTSDSQASQSVEAKKGLEFNAAFSLGRKS